MTREQFDAWAYGRLRAFFEDATPSAVELPGWRRVAAYLATIEGERRVLAPDTVADPN